MSITFGGKQTHTQGYTLANYKKCVVVPGTMCWKYEIFFRASCKQLWFCRLKRGSLVQVQKSVWVQNIEVGEILVEIWIWRIHIRTMSYARCFKFWIFLSQPTSTQMKMLEQTFKKIRDWISFPKFLDPSLFISN